MCCVCLIIITAFIIILQMFEHICMCHVFMAMHKCLSISFSTAVSVSMQLVFFRDRFRRIGIVSDSLSQCWQRKASTHLWWITPGSEPLRLAFCCSARCPSPLHLIYWPGRDHGMDVAQKLGLMSTCVDISSPSLEGFQACHVVQDRGLTALFTGPVRNKGDGHSRAI